jgi:type II secretion system protein C
MNRIFNEKALSVILKILILAAIAKSVSLAAFVVLPKNGVENTHKDAKDAAFNVYGFTLPFSSSASNAQNVQVSQISNLKLLAIYKEANGDGFAVIFDGGSSEVVKNKDAYKQYLIDEIKQDGVYLTENGKKMWVGFEKSTLEASSPQQIGTMSIRDRAGFGMMRQRQENQTNGNEYSSMIPRSEIQDLMSNPDNVFKNIGFKEVMKDGKIDGFRVLSINRNSPLSKLGLRAGDIVQSFNGARLNSYSSVLEIYNNANSISRVKLEVMRNNEKKEFEYEIY